MPNYCQITIAGHVGRDPETRYSTDGKAVSNFSVAYSYRTKGEKATTWFRVAAFDKTADVVSQYVKKGTPVLVSGEMRSREYTDKDGNKRESWEIACNRLVLLGGKSDSDEGETVAQMQKARGKPAGSIGDLEDDPLPF